MSTSSSADGQRSRDLNSGDAGIVLALAELVGTLGADLHRDVLAEAAHRLAKLPFDNDSLPGLYVGEAGVGAALLRAGQVLCNTELVEAAEQRGRFIASLPFGSPDLYNGTAGRLRFHLFLRDETGDSGHLHDAINAGEALLSCVRSGSPTKVRWIIPSGYDGLSGAAFLGYAHGAAGIADALLDLFEATGDARYRAVARRTLGYIARFAQPTLSGLKGLDWPDTEDGTIRGAFWCHGAAGIGLFLLHCGQLQIAEEAWSLARRAARAAAYGARWAGPSQCHGLSGNIELLLDMAQATGERGYFAEASELARLLEAFAVTRDSKLYWSSDSPTVFTPDYMTGYGGVALTLLRLSQPRLRPRQLTRQGFRYTPTSARIAAADSPSQPRGGSRKKVQSRRAGP